MRVVINGKSVLALVDGGSQVSLIQEATCRELGIACTSTVGHSLRSQNDGVKDLGKVCRNVAVGVGGSEVICKFFVSESSSTQPAILLGSPFCWKGLREHHFGQGGADCFVFSSPWTKDRLAPKFNLVASDQFNRELKLWCTIIENTTGQQTGKAQPTMSRKAESLESIGLLTRINWPAWAPAMRLALQSISAFRVATGEQKKPPASQPPNQSLKDYTSLCNDYDAKDAQGRTLIRSHVDENMWFKLKGSAVDASLHQVWTGLVRAYKTNSVPFVGTKTLRAYWNLRYEPGTSVTSFMTEVERLGELCNRQKMLFWKQQLGIGTEELQGFYAQIVDILGEERGKALLSMVLHVDDFAIKTVLMEQLPEKYTFAFREEKDVDLFLEKVRTAYDEDVIMNGANNKEQTEAPASALAAARQEADPGQAPPCNGNCACGQQPHAFATAGQHRGHAGPTRNSYRSGGHGRTGTRVGAKTRAEHYANSDKWGKIVGGKFMCANNQCVNCFGFGHRRAACDSRNPTGDRIAFLQSLDINVPVASHGTYFVEDPVPMSLANRMGASFHFTNYAAEVREQTIFRAATAEAPELIFDTGATTSLVNNKRMLSDYATLDCPIFMIDAAGTRTPAVGRGTLTAEFALADGTTSKMTIADVLHVPNFVVNLISGPSLCKQGVRIEMEEGRCEFSKYGQTFAIAQLVGSKYIFQARLSNLNPTEAQSLTVSMERKETVMGLNIKGEDFDVAKCHGCMQGRGVHANISRGPASRANKPLHAIHADLWGPVRHESFAGEVMVLGLVDDYSRFRWSFPIGKKSSVTALVVEFIQRVERSRDCNVAIFHSDNGGEFVNNSLKAFFWERGIEHRTTVPYAHYQNGVIERGWCTMFETVRIWLLVSGLPLSFWAFAATAFTYVSNRRPTAALPGSTPFEMYHLRKPNVSRFRVWGCVAYVRIAPERRASKIEPPRVKARFIGYAEQGWMFWRPDTNTVFVSDDANFDESSFELHRGNSDDADLREDSPTTLFGDPPTGSLDIDGNDAVEQDFSLDGAGRAQAPGTDDRATAPIAARRAFAPDGNSRDNTPPVGRARAPDREYTPAAPGCERAPGDRVQHSDGQELTPIVPTRRAPAPVVSNGRAPAPVAPNGRAPAPVVPNGRAPAPVAGDGGAPPPVASRRPSPFLDDDADNDPPDPNPIPDGYEPVVPTTERTSELAERWGAPAGSRCRGGAEQQAMFVDLGTILGDVIPLNELPEWEQVLSVVVNLEECNGWTNLSSIVQGSTEGICGIEELEAYQVWTGSPDEPTYKQAMAGEDHEDWSISLMTEYSILNGMNTWDKEATDPPPGVRAIPTKVVLVRKRNDKGDIIKYKARIVARGDLQNHHGETFSPTARIASIRMINVIAHVKGYRRLQFDVNSAYLHGHITEPLWIKLPDGSTHRLRKSLYGLKQSGREWNKVLHAALVDRGFKRMEEDFGVYRRVRNIGGIDRTTLLAIYVDNGLLAGDDNLEGFLNEFGQQFKLKRGEVELFLGMKIATDDASGIMTIDQCHQIETILNNHGFANASAVATPTSDSDQHSDGGTAHLKLNYRQVVGELLWVSGCTRPDISYAVTQLSRHCADPKPEHFRQMRRVLRYLRGTINRRLEYNRHLGIDVTLYCDSDHAAEKSGHRSISGYTVIMAGVAITWASKRQVSVATSSVQAKYQALSAAARETLWICSLLFSLGFPPSSPTIIHGDSTGAIALADHPTSHATTKHIATHYHFTQELVSNGIIELRWIGTKEMVADGFTKGLSRAPHESFVRMLGMCKARALLRATGIRNRDRAHLASSVPSPSG
ncbi:BQ5605_C006g03931 [Microbotryum silenes-dioicae]|uniref:BQ5605_C006g03931 protein n=1 Tax=Microbotryum silenes-dioicae TaxID=796604 RepID=A0A2X0P7S5_9BASI|nr:BQ5605_C006g03931 [Microbotryum silenes-dioicae]